MNYLPFVSFHMYGGTDATERANTFVSWGMMFSLPVLSIVTDVKKLIDLGYSMGQFLKKTTRWL